MEGDQGSIALDLDMIVKEMSIAMLLSVLRVETLDKKASQIKWILDREPYDRLRK